MPEYYARIISILFSIIFTIPITRMLFYKDDALRR